ncbi:DUF4942 domain-containing protein [Buttiauxella sp. S19-1]|uniref:DUF4942 domain-containing protein n=1 Tax=Buttiauxella sp. S19-1 TaxID=941430 RepID=UPI001EDC4609|nr:DUF4942 domain-containing protein [Buttiauxella sp. S19-1]
MTSEIFNTGEFFAPTPNDLVENLMGRYTFERQKIESLAVILNDDDAQVAIDHFMSGNQRDKRYTNHTALSVLFARDGAISHLNAAYWQKALLLTDVLDVMPAARREEWNENILEMRTPEFEEETVRTTLFDMLNSRNRFFGERVDGIFKSLSGEHVTNRPEGFSKRMILSGVYDQWGMTNYKMVNQVLDLRQVIAKFMGRPEPSYELTNKALKTARDYPGEWMSIDGGEMRLRAYLKGTAHFEVHPDIAWRLNCILASLYPLAIPPEFRAKPKKKIKDFVLMQNALPVAVLQDMCLLEIGEYKPRQRNKYDEPVEPKTRNPYNRTFRGYDEDRRVRAESERILSTIGGTKLYSGSWSWWEFEYDPTRVLAEIIASGCVPDDKSHQFYPTPPALAEYCVQLAGIEEDHNCLEPSAGHGNIAEFMPQDQTICVEISSLKCQVLASKGCRVYEADFLKWAQNGGCFDRIVMNPPFSDGRALLHLQTAASLTKTGSRIVAILPGSMRNKDVLSQDWNCTWSEPRSGEFTGTSVSVVILTAERQ